MSPIPSFPPSRAVLAATVVWLGCAPLAVRAVAATDDGPRRAGTVDAPVAADAGDTAPAPDPAAGIAYESAFDDYVPWNEDERPGWVEANDRVGEIGGWRTYARERFESSSDDAEPVR